MKHNTLKLLRTYYFVVDQILTLFSTNKKTDKIRLNTAFKAFYCREYGVEHNSLHDFESEELHTLINRILIEFAVEYGIYLKKPHDPNNAESMSLSAYFEYLRWNMIQDDLSPFKPVSILPNGFILVNDVNELLRLKKGCKRRIPDNMELPMKEQVFIYSHIHKIFYPKIISQFTPYDKVLEYIEKRLLYANESIIRKLD